MFFILFLSFFIQKLAYMVFYIDIVNILQNKHKNNIMATLKLYKKHSGYYINRAKDIQVTVCKYSQGWSGIIERFTHTAKDLENNTVEMFDAISDEMCAPTKKEVCEMLTNWIIKNL